MEAISLLMFIIHNKNLNNMTPLKYRSTANERELIKKYLVTYMYTPDDDEVDQDNN